MSEPEEGRQEIAASQSGLQQAGGVATIGVLHLAHRGGPTITVLRMLPWLQERGPVELVVPISKRAAIEFPDVPIRWLTYGPLVLPRGPLAAVGLLRRFFRETRAFRKLLKERKPDLLLVSTSTLIPPLLAARLAGIPTITIVAEIYRGRSATGRKREVAGKLLLRFIQRLSSAVICCSDAVARQFSRYGHATVTVSYPQIDPDPTPGDGARCRATHAIGPNAPVIASAGDISPGRGQDLMIRAMPAIRDRLPEAVYVVAGEPHERDADVEYARDLRALAASLGVGDAVKFVGLCAEIGDLYAAATVVVNPARLPEAFGRVGPEALAAGRPVVSTRVGGVPEVLEDGRDALLVPPDDPEALAEAILRLAVDEGLAQRLVAQGRESVRSRFGDDQAAAALLRAIDVSLIKPVSRRH